MTMLRQYDARWAVFGKFPLLYVTFNADIEFMLHSLLTLSIHYFMSHSLLTLSIHYFTSHSLLTLSIHYFMSHSLLTLSIHYFTSHSLLTLSIHYFTSHSPVTLFLPRDVKPSNILIWSLDIAVTPNIKLSDYGIAGVVSSAGVKGMQG